MKRNFLAFALVALAVGALSMLGLDRWQAEQTMRREARRVAISFSREPHDFDDVYWLLLQRQHQNHGATLSSADLDRVIGLLDYSTQQPYSMVSTLAFVAICRNPGGYDAESQRKIHAKVFTMLDSPKLARDAGTLSCCLNALAKIEDPGAEKYFEQYRNDPRLLVYNAVAAHFKARRRG